MSPFDKLRVNGKPGYQTSPLILSLSKDEQRYFQLNKNISYKEINDDVIDAMTRTGPLYYVVLAIVTILTLLLFFLPWIYQIKVGQGVTGLNNPSYWGVYLVNFVFWVGVAHAGTLISAMLYITRTQWRRSVHRSAETMTFFALIIAVSFIMVHMGRVWNFYWVLPYPNQRTIWTNFISPLMFDVFAIGTYFLSSLIFLYFGLIPDIAAIRHRSAGWRRRLYVMLSLGWRGTDREWYIRDKAYMLFSVLIMPLVVSVHSIVSWDFALGIVPGLHKTVFAPYFVTGALYSGFAGVVLLISILRRVQQSSAKYITERHYDRIGITLLALSLLWSYLTILEIVMGLTSHSSFELEHLRYKLLNPGFAGLTALMIFSNTILPLSLSIRKVRVSITCQFIISIFILTGMWLERFLIFGTSLPRKFLPYAWHDYHPGWVEIAITAGSFFLFILMFMIFMKIFPVISITEVKEEWTDS